MDDFNAKVGKEATAGVTGSYGLGERNDKSLAHSVLSGGRTCHNVSDMISTTQEKIIHLEISCR